jgi:hypothetical protein
MRLELNESIRYRRIIESDFAVYDRETKPDWFGTTGGQAGGNGQYFIGMVAGVAQAVDWQVFGHDGTEQTVHRIRPFGPCLFGGDGGIGQQRFGHGAEHRFLAGKQQIERRPRHAGSRGNIGHGATPVTMAGKGTDGRCHHPGAAVFKRQV